MVEVFKTNVRAKGQARQLIEILSRHFPACKINFDLHDRDKILRIEGDHFLVESVRMIVEENGCACEILE